MPLDHHEDEKIEGVEGPAQVAGQEGVALLSAEAGEGHADAAARRGVDGKGAVQTLAG